MFNESLNELIANYIQSNENENEANDLFVKQIRDKNENFAAIDGKKLLFIGYFKQIEKEINIDFDNFFGGNFANNDIIKITSKYYQYINSMNIPTPRITKYFEQEIYSIPYTDNNYYNDNNTKNAIFRNVVQLQNIDEYNFSKTNYMLSYGIQLYSMPKQYSSITIKYHVSSTQLRSSWTNIKTFFNEKDVSFMPETVIVDLNDNRIQRHNNIEIKCKIKILLTNGNHIGI